jgi:chromosome segregation protein
LLKLRKVELLGFKSFCEKTPITFSGTGITCIVGPNGCGKSNIVDAISWVLGEQSHKSLRAERMADCIFSGTAKRPPMGLAEVSLTLVDPDLAAAAERVLNGSEENAEAGEARVAVDAEDSASGDSEDEVGAVSCASSASDEAAAADGAEGSNTPAFLKNRRGPQRRSMNVKPGEVVVGRRLYRSGQSEYLINGRVARLRDIQEMFMGVGLGPNSYAIIEQGRIGQILSSKPMDRRAILEEAAGVSKFKTKRRLAEAKLESSKVNLSRVNDILVEVEKQLGSLKRQASKARRYTELREQLRGLLRQVLASKARELDTEAERIERLLAEVAASEREQAQSLTALEAEQETLSARSYELEGEIRANQNQLGQTSLELDRAENRILFNRERTGEIEARSAQLAAEAAAAAGQAAAVEARAAAHGETVAAARTEHAALESEVAALTARTTALAEEERATAARIEELRRASGQLAEELARLDAESAQAEQALERNAEARARLERAERERLDEFERRRGELAAAEQAREDAEKQVTRLDGARNAARERIAGLRGEEQETVARLERVREELAGARERRRTLEQVLNDRTYTADAVQKLFAANGEGPAARDGFRAVGLLADYAEVEERYETAVEQFLRDELQYVVVETFDHARAGIALLRGEVGGRATFFVDSLRNLNLPPLPEDSLPPQAGVVARLDRLVEFRDPLGAAAKQFLPRLRAAYLVEDGAAAERLAGANPQFQFVTLDGTCYNGRLVTGGRPGEAGPLATKREMRLVEAQVAERERAAEEAQAALAWLRDELARAEAALEEAAARYFEAEKDRVAATHRLAQVRAEAARAEQELDQSRQELARIAAEAAAARSRADEAERRRTAASAARADAESGSREAAEHLAALRSELAARQEDLSVRRSSLATLAERLATAEAVAARLDEELRNARARVTALGEQQEALAAEMRELETGTAEQERRRAALAAEKTRLEERRAALEGEWDMARIRLVELEDKLRMARQKLGDLREQRSHHEVERARNDSERSHLREACLAELNCHPEDLLAAETALLAGDELAAAEATQREIKARIEAMGPINMMALEEYKECEQRFEFLTRERNDLVQSIEDTQKTIAELDEICRQKFQEAFTAINQHFAQAFATLFGGGTGEMRLGEPDSSGEMGIDVVAQPPGKRLQNVMLLSGGEKALTALALLIAIFRYQPSPFCILDEVDAPLDEANIGRFAKLISEMSDQTQFIIVTHNRRTMEMAPLLYGVTMQEPGVSKLVSVRWDEQQPAARAASSAA